MNSHNYRQAAEIFFSDRFCAEMRHLWPQLGDEAPDTVADIQRVRLRWDEEPLENQWAIYFVPRELVSAEDLMIIDDHPVYIRSGDKERLKGKLVDFDVDRNRLIVCERT